MKTYYIVQHFDSSDGVPYFMAHSDGIQARLGTFGWGNALPNTTSQISADVCESKLCNLLNPTKPRVVRVVKI